MISDLFRTADRLLQIVLLPLAQFVARQPDRLPPPTVVLSPHDNWLPGFSVVTDVKPIADEFSRAVPGTRLLELGYLDATPVLPVSR